MHLRWWCQIFQASSRALEPLPKAMCPSSYITWRSEWCDRKARDHVMCWEQVRLGMRQEEEPSQHICTLASCGWVLEERLSAGAERGPEWAGADFTHQLWVRNLRNEAQKTGTQGRSPSSSFSISGDRSHFWYPPAKGRSLQDVKQMKSIIPRFHLP